MVHMGIKGDNVAKRTTLDLTDLDEMALHAVMKRYGQQNEAGALRLCIHLMYQAKELILAHPGACLPKESSLSNGT